MAQLEDDKKAPIRSIEERMLTFERECEERYRRDLDDQIAHIRDEEIKKMRLEEKLNAKVEKDILRSELGAEFQQRLVLYAQHEEELTRSALVREKELEKVSFDARQHMLKEIEGIRMKEQALMTKIELESQVALLPSFSLPSLSLSRPFLSFFSSFSTYQSI